MSTNQILESTRSRSFSQVKRLMTDPKELCCPISHELMKDPVVAGDGHTYERSCIEGAVLGVSGQGS